jgi:hypothetical protein
MLMTDLPFRPMHALNMPTPNAPGSCSAQTSGAYRGCNGLLDGLDLAIRLTRVDLLARLLDGVEDGIVVKRVGGMDLSGLRVKRDFEGLNACRCAHGTGQRGFIQGRAMRGTAATESPRARGRTTYHPASSGRAPRRRSSRRRTWRR